MVFALGVSLGLLVRSSFTLAALLFSLAGMIWLRVNRLGFPRTALVSFLAVVLASGWLAAAVSVLRHHRIHAERPSVEAGRALVAGKIAHSTSWRVCGRGSLRVSGELRDAAIRHEGTSSPAYMRRLPFEWFGPDTTMDLDFGLGLVPLPGETWEFHGMIREVPSFSGFSPDRLIRVSVNQADRLRPAAPWQLPARFVLAREHILRRLSRSIEPHLEVGALLRAMLLGDRGGMTADLRRTFIESGTFHVFAVSGLHVGMLSLVGSALLRFAGISRRYWFWFLAPVVVLYVFIVGLRPSAVRAACMVLLYLLAPATGRRPDAFSAWSGAALLILAVRPFDLLTPGFILSFVVVAGLIVWTPVFSFWLDRVGSGGTAADLDRRAAAAGKEGGFSRHRGGLLYRLRQLLAVSLAAWLFSAPLAAYYFGRLVLVAVPANLAMAPLAFVTVATAVMSLLTGLFSASMAMVYNHALMVVAYCMIRVAEVASSLPFSSLVVGSFPGWVAAAVILLLLRLGLGLGSGTDFCDPQQ